jgi:hypothetical protein
VHIEDAATDPEYTRAEAVQLGRQRTMLGLPLVREDALIGVITLAAAAIDKLAELRRARVFGFASQLKRAARAWLFACARGARFTLSKAPAGAMMAHNHRESGVCRLRWLRAGPISSA